MAWQQQLLRVVSASACVALLGACSSPARTATNFCRQLADELPEIADLPATDEQISDAVQRYERLLEVAPLEIEKEFDSLTALMRAARDVDAADNESVQALVELTYSSEKDALASSAWVLATCGVDLSLGISPSAP
jgi:hypothetical protein